jgi:hypothetical protein
VSNLYRTELATPASCRWIALAEGPFATITATARAAKAATTTADFQHNEIQS